MASSSARLKGSIAVIATFLYLGAPTALAESKGPEVHENGSQVMKQTLEQFLHNPNYSIAGSNLYTFSNAPEVIQRTGNQVVIIKPQTETTSYATSGSDVLYRQQYAPYTLSLPNGIRKNDILSAVLTISGTLDDHYNQSPSLYTGAIFLNHRAIFSGPWEFSHGTPYAGPSTNYTTMNVNVTRFIHEFNQLTLVNTTNSWWITGYPNWISINGLELTITLRPSHQGEQGSEEQRNRP